MLWNKEKIELLIELYKDGKSNDEIAEIVGLTAKQIKTKKINLGIRSPNKIIWDKEKLDIVKAMREENKSMTQICKKLNISISSLARIIKKENLLRTPERKPLSIENELKIKDLLNNFHLEYKDIAKISNVSTFTVSKVNRKYSIRRTNVGWTKEECIKLTNAINNNSTIEELISLFNRSQLAIATHASVIGIRHPIINKMINDYDIKNNSFTRIIQSKVANAKCTSRNKGYEFNLNSEYVTELYKLQNGKCAYSGIEMNNKDNDLYQLSIDRVNSDLGYTKNNIKLCCWVFNLMKRDHSETLFIKLCTNVVDNFKNQSNASSPATA